MMPPTPDAPRKYRDRGYGVCPECGTHSGPVFTPGRHWIVCDEHRTRWLAREFDHPPHPDRDNEVILRLSEKWLEHYRVVTPHRQTGGPDDRPDDRKPPVDGRYPDSGFGVCPHCRSQDGYLNMSKYHWFVCNVHRTKWRVGYNLLSSWQFEDENTWKQNEKTLAAYTLVEPVHVPDAVGHGDVDDSAGRIPY